MSGKMSKTAFVLLFIALTTSGCAFNRRAVLTTPVGPPPSAVPSRSNEGTLAVYSALDYDGTGMAEYSNPHHSGYRLLDVDGTPLKYISNRPSTHSEDPEIVPLPPGSYKVLARASAFGTVTVPVVIEAGKATSVHLDGSEPLGWSRGPAPEFVNLPDGLIIGWRAKAESVQP